MSEIGASKSGLMNIGEEAKPPFAVLPDPSSLFISRANRFAALAPGNELSPYLQFLSVLARAQHDSLAELPAAKLPGFEAMGQALEHGMPPVARQLYVPDDVVELTIERVLGSLGAEVPPETARAIAAVRSATGEERRAMAAAVLKDGLPNGDLAQHVLIASGLQVHFARLAAMLNADDLKPVADGACPTCGSAPMTTSVVGWPRAYNTRFCTCWLCATMWNVVRVKCVLCGSTESVSYLSIEGKSDRIKAETCEKCRGYVKILYQVSEPGLEPLADDVATLDLDMLVTESGWKRGGQNPFLLGY